MSSFDLYGNMMRIEITVDRENFVKLIKRVEKIKLKEMLRKMKNEGKIESFN